MKRRRGLSVLLVTAALGASGCTYVRDRVLDFGDIWRMEGSVGVGAQVTASAGELAHVGLGSSRRYTLGWTYGHAVSEKRTEDHLPLSYIWSLADPNEESLHSLKLGDESAVAQHRCALILPYGIGGSTLRKPPIHFWNLEIGVLAGILGVELGFSLGEFADFLVGWAGLDLAADDASGNREGKHLWERPPEPVRSHVPRD
ncbi:MAG: hypothetical protein HY716_14330 [Planctomycetes bacterium]|nr:hypothetical protein [Planctomycetota bacterium]